jgi:hypothetical protein
MVGFLPKTTPVRRGRAVCRRPSVRHGAAGADSPAGPRRPRRAAIRAQPGVQSDASARRSRAVRAAVQHRARRVPHRGSTPGSLPADRAGCSRTVKAHERRRGGRSMSTDARHAPASPSGGRFPGRPRAPRLLSASTTRCAGGRCDRAAKQPLRRRGQGLAAPPSPSGRAPPRQRASPCRCRDQHVRERQSHA